MPKVILYVDDEPGYSLPYRLELELRGYNIIYCETVEQTMEQFAKPQGTFDCVVLDIIMAPGTIFTPVETNDGLDSGLLLFKQLRMTHPQIPVVVVTARPDEKVQQTFAGDSNVSVLRKSETLTPFNVADEVDKKGKKNNA